MEKPDSKKIYLTNFIIVLATATFLYVAKAQSNLSPTLLLHLQPLYNNKGVANNISVSYKLPFYDSAFSDTLRLNLDLMENLGRKADTVENLVVKDDAGVVPFTASSKDAVNNRLVYKALRKTSGTVRVSYSIMAASYDRVGGGNIDMQVSEGGLSGAFISILLLPAFQNKFFVSLDWDLPPGNKATSTFGDGNVTSETKVGYEELLYAQFIMGKLNKYPAVAPKHGFRVAGLGLKDSQVKNSLPVYQKVYEELRSVLKGSPNMSFLFIYRSFPGLPFSSGSATTASKNGSFLVYITPTDKLADNEDMVALVAHEMVHVFLRGVNSDWYDEGIADYLSATIPHNAGFYSDSMYLKLLNQSCAMYYTNPYRLVPDTAIEAVKFNSAISWALPYSRGMLYFANLNAKLKEKALVKNTTVLSLVLEIDSLSNHQKITENTWVELLAKKAGSWAVTDWQDMKAGKLFVPRSTSFGSKYTIKKINTGYYDLGFDSPHSIRKDSVIAGLDENSNAAKAGLRNGDKITKTVDLYPVYTSFDKKLSFKVERNGEILTITYLPKKENIYGWKWFERK